LIAAVDALGKLWQIANEKLCGIEEVALRVVLAMCESKNLEECQLVVYKFLSHSIMQVSVAFDHAARVFQVEKNAIAFKQ